MGRQVYDTEKEPFLREPEPSAPVRFGDMMISYGKDDPVTQANLKKLSEEEERMGTEVHGKEYTRVKQLGEGYELRRFKPYHFWRCFKNGVQIETVGDYTDLKRAEDA